MLRTVITPTKTDIHLSIPEDYIGKQVEITCFALEELQQNTSSKTIADFWGVLSNTTAETLHKQVVQNRNEWDI